MIDSNLLEGKEEQDWHDQSQIQSRPPYSPQCIGCKCESCDKNKKTLDEIKELINKKLDVKMVTPDYYHYYESVRMFPWMR